MCAVHEVTTYQRKGNNVPSLRWKFKALVELTFKHRTVKTETKYKSLKLQIKTNSENA